MDINGKRIVLTGAASGIGKAILDELNTFACQIIAVDLQSVRAMPKRAEIHEFLIDLTQPEAVDQICDFAIDTLGGIDIFIANAGFAYYESFDQPDWGRIERLYRINVFSPLYTVAKMRELNPDREHLVVVTASAMGLIALPGYALYGSTKAAIHQFAWAYRFEKPQHARLMLVYPIATRTSFFQGAHHDTPVVYPTQSAQFVARRVVVGILDDRQAVKPSPGFQAMWIISRVFPVANRVYQQYALWLFGRWRKRHGS